MTPEAEVLPEPLTTLSPIIDNQGIKWNLNSYICTDTVFKVRVGLKRNKRKNKRNKFKQKETSVF